MVKKAHTDKNVVVVNYHTQQVAYLSPTQPGKTHDKKLADQAAIAYPVAATLGKDTGFQGYEPLGVLTWQPTKKPRGRPLSVEAKYLNRQLASARILVEPVLAAVKRARIVKDTFRNTKSGFSDTVMEVACALHNLRTHFRHPLPVLKLVAWPDPYSE